MAPTRNARAYYAVRPIAGYIEPDVHVKYDDTRSIDLDTEELDGGFLLKTLCLSIDPYMRSRMRDPKIRSYFDAFELNQPLSGYGIGKVMRSEDDHLEPGDVVHGWMFHEEYSVYKDYLRPVIAFRKIDNIGLPWSVYTGVLGVPGQTAYYGWKAYSKAKAGEVAFVSTAAGAVGSLVVQLAKRDGLRVIAASGSDDKCAFASECGADVSFNYKTNKIWDVLSREAKGIDVYFDNAGGEHLDAALANASKLARFIECGMTSQYNGQVPYTLKNLGMIIGKEITLQGLFHHSLSGQYEDEFYETMPLLVKDGSIKYLEDISFGLETVGQALHDVGAGKNFGKRVVILGHGM